MRRIGWTLLLLLPTTASLAADAPALSPEAVCEGIEKDVAELRAAREYTKARSLPLRRAREYLAARTEPVADAAGEDGFYLGKLLEMAGRPREALDRFRASLEDETLPADLRPGAAAGIAHAVLRLMNSGDLAGEAAAKAVRHAEGRRKIVAKAGGSTAMAYHRDLAYACDRLGRTEACVAHWMEAARAEPAVAYAAARSVLPALMHPCYRLDEYDALRKRGAALTAELEALYRGYVEKLRTVLDALLAEEGPAPDPGDR